MRNRAIVAPAVFVIFYIAFGAYVTLNQEKIVYHPFPQDFDSCSHFIEAEKVTYEGTRMYVEMVANKPIVVVYHGNAGSACDRYFYADIFSQAGYGYAVVEYAGYSNDTEQPSHTRLKQDVRNVVSYLEEQELSPVFVIGESIGTGAAAYHASLSAPEKLLLISPFTDLKAIAAHRFWFYPTRLLVDNAFDNVQALENYGGATLIIHGTADTIIPYKLGERLSQSLSQNKNLVPIVGGGHNDLFSYESTYQAINEFLSGTP